MPNLVESSVYEPGIYQLETTDPVMGGSNGVDNLQAKQLANRTQWLKSKVIEKVLLKKTLDQSLANSVFSAVSFDQVDTSSDPINIPFLPTNTVAVPSGVKNVRVSANVVFKTSASINNLLYSMGLVINYSQVSQFGTGQGRKFMGNYLYPTEYLSMNIITPFIPVTEGDLVGISCYVSSSSISVLGGQSWMQMEFLK